MFRLIEPIRIESARASIAAQAHRCSEDCRGNYHANPQPRATRHDVDHRHVTKVGIVDPVVSDELGHAAISYSTMTAGRNPHLGGVRIRPAVRLTELHFDGT